MALRMYAWQMRVEITLKGGFVQLYAEGVTSPVTVVRAA